MLPGRAAGLGILHRGPETSVSPFLTRRRPGTGSSVLATGERARMWMMPMPPRRQRLLIVVVIGLAASACGTTGPPPSSSTNSRGAMGATSSTGAPGATSTTGLKGAAGSTVTGSGSVNPAGWVGTGPLGHWVQALYGCREFLSASPKAPPRHPIWTSAVVWRDCPTAPARRPRPGQGGRAGATVGRKHELDRGQTGGRARPHCATVVPIPGPRMLQRLI